MMVCAIWELYMVCGSRYSLQQWHNTDTCCAGPYEQKMAEPLIDQLHVVGIYHVLKAHNFPEFLGYII